MSPPGAASPGAPHAPGDPLAIWLLAVGQTMGYACLYYSFGALLLQIGEDTGWSSAHIALGLTLALLTSAASATFTGRGVDRGRGAEILTFGAALGGVVVILASRAHSLWQWYLAWALVGPAMSASLYETCFAFLTRRLGPQARPAIIRVTLVAGLASTIAFPLGALLADHGGWRFALAGFGLLEICIGAPVMFYAGVRLRRADRLGGPQPPAHNGALRPAMRRGAFWLLAFGFATAWMNHSMLVTFFIPTFTGLGTSHALAVAAASTVGPFQVIGRIILMLLGHRAPTLASTNLAFALLAAASALLLAAGIAPQLVFAFAVLQGSAIGILSILRPVLIAEVMGREGFGAISGAIAMGPLLGTAAAPMIGAGVFSLGGPHALVMGSLALGALGLVLTMLLRGMSSH